MLVPEYRLGVAVKGNIVERPGRNYACARNAVDVPGRMVTSTKCLEECICPCM